MHGSPGRNEYFKHCPAGGFFFAVFSLFRFALHLGLLERPLVAGFFLALITGEVFPVLLIAVFFELLWLDLIPAGTFIPPNAIFCVTSVTLLYGHFQLEHTGQIFLLMLLSIPGAYILSRIEGWYRIRQNKKYNLILRQSRDRFSSYNPGKMIMQSLVGSFGVGLVTACLGIYFLAIVYPHLKDLFQFQREMDWSLILLAASFSALAGLRVKKAYTSLVVGMVLISAALAWMQWPVLA
ncbi:MULTISPECIES: PTS sugar transporter subunit IIC [Desulfonatronospira]|uniref:PTS sugar transporter subunit IIC n=1 Tax=Desulfonatronospira TaxID=488937 RepID=UPI0024467850|nr:MULTISPECIES: PTS sugar transporter subunit IIC [Desulfonatronospira]